MKLGFVRVLDYYVGIFVCLILTIANKFIALWRKPFQLGEKVEKVLFIELSEMGSTVLAYSAMDSFHKKLPRASLFFLIFQKNKESVELLKIIPKENILTIREDNLLVFFIDNIKLLVKFCSLKFDVVYDLELFSRYSAILTYLSGARSRIGFHKHTAEGLYRGNLLTHKVYYNTHVHMVYNFFALIHSIFKDASQIPIVKESKNNYSVRLPEFEFSEQLLFKFKNLLSEDRKTIIVNPHAGSLLPIRSWGIENFSRVIDKVVGLYDPNIVIVGLKEASKDAKHILNYVQNNRNIVDLTGKTRNLYELIHVIQIGDVFLTNDSGPGHFASLTDTPTIVLYGPETPDLYGPLSQKSIPMYKQFLCSPCLTARNHRNTKCINNKCLQAIKPEEVIERIKEFF